MLTSTLLALTLIPSPLGSETQETIPRIHPSYSSKASPPTPDEKIRLEKLNAVLKVMKSDDDPSQAIAMARVYLNSYPSDTSMAFELARYYVEHSRVREGAALFWKLMHFQEQDQIVNKLNDFELALEAAIALDDAGRKEDSDWAMSILGPINLRDACVTALKLGRTEYSANPRLIRRCALKILAGNPSDRLATEMLAYANQRIAMERKAG